MKLPKYQLAAEQSLTVFDFVSEGPRGRIPKIVKYSGTNVKDFFNLAFGDKDPITDAIDDVVISDNGDSEMVLATVVATLYAFTDRYPNAFVFATGSTKSRTRLYRIGIVKHLNEIRKDFRIFGLRNDMWENFERNIEYEGFLAQRKKH